MHRFSWVAVAGAVLVFGIKAAAWSDDPASDGAAATDNAPASQETADDSALGPYYGFRTPELFKLDERADNLVARDLNGDGLADLTMIDNAHSRINVLVMRGGKLEDTPTEEPGRINEIASHPRFQHRKVPVNRQLMGLVVGQFTADALADLACVNDADELEIRPQDASGRWSIQSRIKLDDVAPTPNGLAVGDLNGDGLDDLALVGTKYLYVLYQKSDRQFGDPEKLPNTAEEISDLFIADLSGDGLSDLVYLAGDDEEQPVCARLQQADHRLGPEIRLELPSPRAVTMADVDGKPGVEIVAIEDRTNRTSVRTFEYPQNDGSAQTADAAVGHVIRYGLARESRNRPGDAAVADLDGDGRLDVVASDHGGAQMIVLRQQPSGGLDQGTAFSGLVGAQVVRAADLDGDGRAEVVVASDQEKAIGVSRFADGRLTFPQALPVVDTPESLDLVDTDGDGRREIVYFSRVRKGQRTERALRVLAQDGQGGWKAGKFGSLDQVPVELRSDSRTLVSLDANRDGRNDYLICAGSNEPPVFLSTSEKGEPAVIASDTGVGLAGTAAEGIFVGQLQGPVLLMAQKNFARNVALDPQGRWQVIDQYNAPAGASVTGVATLDADGDGQGEVVLIDQPGKKIHLYKMRDGVYRPWQRVNLGTITFQAAHVADLNGDGSQDLLVVGAEQIAVLYTRTPAPRLRELASFESKLRDVRFSDVAAGDLNADGRADLVLIDANEQYLQFLALSPNAELLPALHFKLYESKGFNVDREGGLEPREVVVADVTGDSRQDLIFLVHDRVLVLPQDDGSEVAAPTAAAADQPAAPQDTAGKANGK